MNEFFDWECWQLQQKMDMDRLAAERDLEKAKMATAEAAAAQAAAEATAAQAAAEATAAQASAEATAAAAARPPQTDHENDAGQFDDNELAAQVETLKAIIHEMEGELVTRGRKPEVAEDHPVTSYQAKLALAATLEQTIKDHREIVEHEVTEHGAFLDEDSTERMVDLSNQAASMQEIANTAQDLFFYFQNIWLLCLMRLMCLM